MEEARARTKLQMLQQYFIFAFSVRHGSIAASASKPLFHTASAVQKRGTPTPAQSKSRSSLDAVANAACLPDEAAAHSVKTFYLDCPLLNALFTGADGVRNQVLRASQAPNVLDEAVGEELRMSDAQKGKCECRIARVRQ